MIDFAGGTLASLPPEAADQIKPVVSVAQGEVRTQTLFKIPTANIWRLVLDVHANPGATVELSAHLSGWGDTLSEIWAYQWIKP